MAPPSSFPRNTANEQDDGDDEDSGGAEEPSVYFFFFPKPASTFCKGPLCCCQGPSKIDRKSHKGNCRSSTKSLYKFTDTGIRGHLYIFFFFFFLSAN